MRPKNRKDYRRRRHLRIRKRVNGTAARPRMAVYVSNRRMYVQFIDDDAAATLAAVSSLKNASGCNLDVAREVGERAAKAALEHHIREAVVDRGGFRYHGRVRQIVEAAVAGGLRVRRGEESAEDKEAVAT